MEQTRSLLPATWPIPEALRARFGANAGRQRARLLDGHLVILLHSLPKDVYTEPVPRIFWRAPVGEWQTSMTGSGLAGMESHLTEFENMVETLEVEEKNCNSAFGYFALLERLAPIFRTASHLHATLQDARDLVPADGRIINFRDRAYQISRSFELLQQAAQFGLEYAIAKKTEEEAENGKAMAESAHRLNILAAVFLPVATLSSLFGMNIQSGLERSPAPYGFIAALASGLLLGIFIYHFVVRKRSRI